MRATSLFLFTILATWVTQEAWARTCNRTKTERRSSRYTCHYYEVLGFLPGLEGCQRPKNESINSLQRKILENQEAIPLKKKEEGDCKILLDLLQEKLGGQKNYLEAKTGHGKSVKAALKPYPTHIARSQAQLHHLEVFRPFLLEILPDLASHLREVLIRDQGVLEEIIQETEDQIKATSLAHEKLKLQAKLIILKETATLTDAARGHCQSEDLALCVSKILQDIFEGREKELPLVINKSHLKFVELVLQFQTDQLSSAEIYKLMEGEEKKHKVHLEEEKQRLEKEVQVLEGEIAHLQKKVTEGEKKTQEKQGECSGLTTQIQTLEEEIKVNQREIPKIQEELKQCEEVHSRCVWREGTCKVEGYH